MRRAYETPTVRAASGKATQRSVGPRRFLTPNKRRIQCSTQQRLTVLPPAPVRSFPRTSDSYAIHELCVSKADGDRPLAAEKGTSLYCIGGRGWASFPGGHARYALEPGTVFATTRSGCVIIIHVLEDLTMLKVDTLADTESGGRPGVVAQNRCACQTADVC